MRGHIWLFQQLLLLSRNSRFVHVRAWLVVVLEEFLIYRLGFELLEYSYAPIGFPTPVCAKVVESEI